MRALLSVLLFASVAQAAPAPLRSVLVLPDEAQAVSSVEVHRSPPGEPVRALVEYVAAAAVFTGVNAAGAALLDAPIHVTKSGGVDLNGNEGRFIGAGACFLLSPLASALTSYFIGRGSDTWRPGAASPILGGYGMGLVSLGAGYLLATTDVDRNTQMVANGALFLAVPLASVLLQNAFKEPRVEAAP